MEMKLRNIPQVKQEKLMAEIDIAELLISKGQDEEEMLIA